MDEPAALVGKVLLIGISVYRADGVFIRKTQVHGLVKEIDADAGIVVEVAETGREFSVPPAIEHIHPARPGLYRARDTGEEIRDPDYVTQWSVRLQEGADETAIDWTGEMDWRPGPPPTEATGGLH